MAIQQTQNENCRKIDQIQQLFTHRFICEHCPLTLTIQDNVGRTALHYAAALNDNGEAFGVLEGYGADPNKEDEVTFFSNFIGLGTQYNMKQLQYQLHIN